MIAAREIAMVRTFLTERSVHPLEGYIEGHLPSLRISDLMEFGEVRVFPGKKLDRLDTGEEFLEKFGTLISENHGLLAGPEHEPRESRLDRCHDEEGGKTGQSTRTQVDQEDDHTNNQLDWSGPDRMEETRSKVNTRNVSGDVVDQFPIGVDIPSTSGEHDGLVVDRSNQSRAQ